jgi:hypothetical protein
VEKNPVKMEKNPVCVEKNPVKMEKNIAWIPFQMDAICVDACLQGRIGAE